MQNSKNVENLKKILVVRNDKLGDLLVSFSTFALLKQNLPHTEIHVLVSDYTAPMAKMCEFIDQVIIDPATVEANHQPGAFRLMNQLSKQLEQNQYDAVITLFSTLHVALAAFLARIPLRIAPATKIAQIFYNIRLRQQRSRSEMPESRYNEQLAELLLAQYSITSIKPVKPPFLHFNPAEIHTLKQRFLTQHNIPDNHQLVFIHPGSGGSAGNLSIPQFARLANALTSTKPFTIVITSGPGQEESRIAKQLSQQISCENVLFESKAGLENFSQHLQFVDCLICGSTGPLHIAGALDRPTAAFYTRRQSATALRWQTLNSEKNRLAFSPPDESEPENMANIDIHLAAKDISQNFL